MTVQALLEDLSRLGVTVRICEDGALGVKPRNKLTDEILTTLRQHKLAIIAALTSPATGTNLTRASEQQDLWQPRQIAEVCEKCGDPACWLSPLGRWCVLKPMDQEKAGATKTKKGYKTQPVSRPARQLAPDEVVSAYWIRRYEETLGQWKRKDWGPCHECGQTAWYQHLGFSLCGICTPLNDYGKTVQ